MQSRNRLIETPVASVFALVLTLFLPVPRAASAQTAGASQSTELTNIAKLLDRVDLVSAEARLKRYLLTHPRSPRANQLLGTLYLRQGRPDQAEIALRKALEAAPAKVEVRLALGDALVQRENLEQAELTYGEAARIAPQDSRPQLALAGLYSRQGRFAESLAAAERIPSDKRTPELLPILAADYFGLRQPEKGQLEIQSMLSVALKYPDLVPELAEFFLTHGDFQSSEQLVNLAKEKQPATERWQIDIARTQAGSGRLEAAQETLEAVLERNPESVETLIAAGQLAKQQGDMPASEEAFARAVGLAPDRTDALSGLVAAKLYQNRAPDALQNSQRLHELMPGDLRATYFLALAEFGSQKFDQAKVHADEVLSAHPDDREMNLVLADIAFNNESDLITAKKHATAVLKAFPNDAGALYYQGMIQKTEGELAGAIGSLAASVAANPRNANAQGALGSLYLQTGQPAAAIGALEQAVSLSPAEAQNHYQLALAYTRTGATEKAKVQLQLYQSMKEKQERTEKAQKGPTSSQIAPTAIPGRP